MNKGRQKSVFKFTKNGSGINNIPCNITATCTNGLITDGSSAVMQHIAIVVIPVRTSS